MSWCSVADIGEAAQIRHIEAIQDLFYEEGLVFFDPDRTWYVRQPAYTRISQNEVIMDAIHKVDTLASVEMYELPGVWDPIPITATHIEGRILTLNISDNQRIGPMKFVGAVGLAKSTDLTVGEGLAPGQSILRDGGVMLITEDDNAIAQDKLLTGPGILRSMAISVGNRIMKLEVDEDIDDADSRQLFDGWEEVLMEYNT